MFHFKTLVLSLFIASLSFNSQANFAITKVYEVGGDTAPDSEWVEDINNDGSGTAKKIQIGSL